VAIDQMKEDLRAIARRFSDKEERSKRLFIAKRAVCFSGNEDKEFHLKQEVSRSFGVPYTSVSFSGSAQLGFSIRKETLFEPGVSDLDVACIDMQLFQKAWIDVIQTTRAFSDLTKFGKKKEEQIGWFKDRIVKRGMILVDEMPQSELSKQWRASQDQIGRKYAGLFSRVSVAIYLNEYAFCWKQNSSIVTLMEVGFEK